MERKAAATTCAVVESRGTGFAMSVQLRPQQLHEQQLVGMGFQRPTHCGPKEQEHEARILSHEELQKLSFRAPAEPYAGLSPSPPSSAACIPQLLHESFSCPVCSNWALPIHILPACGHMLCQSCSSAWLSRASSCPMCRSPVSEDPVSCRPIDQFLTMALAGLNLPLLPRPGTEALGTGAAEAGRPYIRAKQGTASWKQSQQEATPCLVQGQALAQRLEIPEPSASTPAAAGMQHEALRQRGGPETGGSQSWSQLATRPGAEVLPLVTSQGAGPPPSAELADSWGPAAVEPCLWGLGAGSSRSGSRPPEDSRTEAGRREGSWVEPGGMEAGRPEATGLQRDGCLQAALPGRRYRPWPRGYAADNPFLRPMLCPAPAPATLECS